MPRRAALKLSGAGGGVKNSLSSRAAGVAAASADMGVVYRAEELALQRRVALELILPEYSRDERFRERFRRESRIAAAIDHPTSFPASMRGKSLLFAALTCFAGQSRSPRWPIVAVGMAAAIRGISTL